MGLFHILMACPVKECALVLWMWLTCNENATASQVLKLSTVHLGPVLITLSSASNPGAPHHLVKSRHPCTWPRLGSRTTRSYPTEHPVSCYRAYTQTLSTLHKGSSSICLPHHAYNVTSTYPPPIFHPPLLHTIHNKPSTKPTDNSTALTAAMTTTNNNNSASDEPTVPIISECLGKFSPDGHPHACPGATVICHLRPGDGSSSPHDAIYRAITEYCFPNPDPAVHQHETVPQVSSLLQSKYVQLPAPSLHMTILDVAVYAAWRLGEARWADLAAADNGKGVENHRAAELQRYMHVFADADLRAEMQALLPIRMVVYGGVFSSSTTTTTDGEIPDIIRGSSLVVPLAPASTADADKIRKIRGSLAARFEMPPPNPGFQFHITTHYPLHAVTETEFAALNKDWKGAVAKVEERVGERGFLIDRVELCSFEDMCAFRVVDSVN